jgi:hypothetical protein
MIITVPGVIIDGTTPVTATPARLDIVVYQGVDTTIIVPITGSNGVATNITGWTGTLTLKDRLLPNQGKPAVLNTYAATLGTPTLGIMTFTIPGTDLKSLQLISYWWDVFTLNASSKRDEPVPYSLMTVNVAPGA